MNEKKKKSSYDDVSSQLIGRCGQLSKRFRLDFACFQRADRMFQLESNERLSDLCLTIQFFRSRRRKSTGIRLLKIDVLCERRDHLSDLIRIPKVQQLNQWIRCPFSVGHLNEIFQELRIFSNNNRRKILPFSSTISLIPNDDNQRMRRIETSWKINIKDRIRRKGNQRALRTSKGIVEETVKGIIFDFVFIEPRGTRNIQWR